jgi:hypothetical protein
VNLKQTAATALASAIGADIAALNGNYAAGSDDEEVKATYPALRVIPREMEFSPFQENETGDDAGTDVAAHTVACVGDFEGTAEIRIYSESRSRREHIEELVLDLFLRTTEGAPGMLTAQTPQLVLRGRQTLHAATVSAFLEDEDWQEEMVFAKKRYSFIQVQFVYPALVLREAYDIDNLQLAIAYELDATEAEETVSIDENGVLSDPPT